jgi:hypothetical protein
MSTTTAPILNILSQSLWHDTAVIIGNREGLLALRHTIDAALLAGSACPTVAASDGASYRVAVCHRDDMADAPLGYTSHPAAEPEDLPWPDWLKKASRLTG